MFAVVLYTIMSGNLSAFMPIIGGGYKERKKIAFLGLHLPKI